MKFFFDNLMLTAPILGMSIYILLPVSPQLVDFLIPHQKDVYSINQADLQESVISITKGFSAIGGLALVGMSVTILYRLGESLKSSNDA
jgi:fucose permease